MYVVSAKNDSQPPNILTFTQSPQRSAGSSYLSGPRLLGGHLSREVGRRAEQSGDGRCRCNRIPARARKQRALQPARFEEQGEQKKSLVRVLHRRPSLQARNPQEHTRSAAVPPLVSTRFRLPCRIHPVDGTLAPAASNRLATPTSNTKTRSTSLTRSQRSLLAFHANSSFSTRSISTPLSSSTIEAEAGTVAGSINTRPRHT